MSTTTYIDEQWAQSNSTNSRIRIAVRIYFTVYSDRCQAKKKALDMYHLFKVAQMRRGGKVLEDYAYRKEIFKIYYYF